MGYQDNVNDDEIYIQGDYSTAGSVRLKEVSTGVYAIQKISNGAWSTKSLSGSDMSGTTGTITTLNATNIDAGASGTAGSVDIFPATAAKGKLTLACANQTGDTAVTVTAAAMGQATAIGIPDPGGASADVVLTAGTQTIAGAKSFTGTLAGTGIGITQIARQSADVVKDDGAAASALTGLTHTLVAGTYAYRIVLQTLSTANGGVKLTFALTTAVLGSIQNVARAFTASAVACARSTTATSGATLYGATAAITQLVAEGTFVVSTGGTIQLQGEQNASHADESTFYAGSTFEITRIA